jgi:predicted helicase
VLAAFRLNHLKVSPFRAATPLADDQAGFEDNDRSKMIMASGTGRTVTSLRITVAMGC